VRFQCPNCQGVVAIDDSEGGKAVACGHCNCVVAVPLSRFSSGAVVGDFVLREKLGEGAVGTVFLAHQISLDRPAALKIMRSSLAADEEFQETFLHEARAAAKLNHPGIVHAYAVGEDEGVQYFAMEYVQGSTLKQVLTHSGRIVLERAVSVIKEVAEALAFAWENQQLVHRDIKPDNIMLTEDGHVKVADLGLAKVAGDMLSEDAEHVYGTPQYISPEQLLGEAVDCRSDIYSLGATFYHCLTGRYPFTGAEASEIASKHLYEALIPPQEIIPDIPDPVSDMVEVMMAKKPEYRYQTLKELLVDFANIQAGKPLKRSLSATGRMPLEGEEGEAEIEADAPAEAADELKPPKARRLKPAGSGKKKIKISKSGATGGGGIKLRRSGGASDGTEADDSVEELPPPEEGEEGAVPPEEEEGGGAPGKKGNGLVIAVAALVALAVLGGGGYYGYTTFIRGSGEEDPNEEPANRGLDIKDVRKMVEAGAPGKEILSAAASVLQENPGDAEGHAELASLTEKYVEEEIRELRTPRIEKDIEKWKAESEELKKAEEERLAEIARQDAEAEAARKAEEEAARKAAEHEQRLQGLATLRDEIRGKYVTFCREHRYAEAKLLFVEMSECSEREYSSWARNMLFCVESAEKTFNLICNSGEKLKGMEYAVPGSRTKGQIEFISRRDIEVKVSEQVLDRRTNNFVNKETRHRFALAELRAPQMWGLCHTIWRKGGNEDESELNTLFGCYLVARGTFLDEAKKKLTAGKQTNVATAALAEIDAIGPVLRQKQWETMDLKLREFVNAGEPARATAYAKFIQQRYPQIFEEHRADIMRILNPE